MLPILPTAVVPLAPQDAAKVRPDPPPVAPVQPSSGDNSVGLDQRRADEAAERLREEQRRRQRRGYSPEQLAAGAEAEDPETLEELPRQGLWIDIEV